jgi:hypothetical protein
MPAKIIICVLLLASTARASEVQRHGLSFEQWVADTFFDGYRVEQTTQKWDIPAAANTRHGGVPVNPKATQYGEPVLLGDALRQFDIDEPFWLIVGFWRQKGGDKEFVQSVAARINPAQWRELWAPITRSDLEEMDRLVKDTAKSVEDVRRAVLRRKKQPPFSQAVIQLNPKIDTRQRRLQCSISYVRLFQKLAPERSRKPVEHPEIFGRPIPDIPASPRRTLGAPSAPN